LVKEVGTRGQGLRSGINKAKDFEKIKGLNRGRE
jgi:hypothetical protein